MWTVQASGDTRPYQTSQNSRTIMPQRPKPTPTSRTRSGAIFISASTQKGMFCQLLVPILLARTEDALELVDERTLCHREPAEPEPEGHRGPGVERARRVHGHAVGRVRLIASGEHLAVVAQAQVGGREVMGPGTAVGVSVDSVVERRLEVQQLPTGDAGQLGE